MPEPQYVTFNFFQVILQPMSHSIIVLSFTGGKGGIALIFK